MKSAELKETYLLGVHFCEQVQNISLNFSMSPNYQGPKGRRKYYGTRYDTNTVFVTLYLPSTISNTAVTKGFMEFGTVHTVFAGRFKNDLQSICNGKRHVRLTPHGSKHDLPFEVQFLGDGRFFQVLWTEKIISCKKCTSSHMLSKKCEDVLAQHNEDAVPETEVSEANVAVQALGPGDPGFVTEPTISSVNHADIGTQNEVPDNNQMVSRLEESNHVTGPVLPRPVDWGDIPDELPSELGPSSSTLPERATCVDGANRDIAASLVPAIDARTEPDCNDALAPPNKVSSPVFSNGEVLSSDPVSKSNDSLNATATAVATKLSSRTGDKGPP